MPNQIESIQIPEKFRNGKWKRMFRADTIEIKHTTDDMLMDDFAAFCNLHVERAMGNQMVAYNFLNIRIITEVVSGASTDDSAEATVFVKYSCSLFPDLYVVCNFTETEPDTSGSTQLLVGYEYEYWLNILFLGSNQIGELFVHQAAKALSQYMVLLDGIEDGPRSIVR